MMLHRGSGKGCDAEVFHRQYPLFMALVSISRNQAETNEAARCIRPIHVLVCTALPMMWPLQKHLDNTLNQVCNNSFLGDSVSVWCGRDLFIVTTDRIFFFFTSMTLPNVFVVQWIVYARPIFNLPDKANRHNRHSMHTATTSQSRRCRQSLCQCLAGGSCQL